MPGLREVCQEVWKTAYLSLEDELCVLQTGGLETHSCQGSLGPRRSGESQMSDIELQDFGDTLLGLGFA